jgi:hypothetical protein
MTENNFNYDLKTTVEEVPVAEDVVEPEIIEDVKVEEPVVAEVAEEPKVETTKKTEKKNSSDTVAIYSSKNISWQEVGTVSKGYNIVSKEASKQWLKRKDIRLASPEEVAKEFGL